MKKLILLVSLISPSAFAAPYQANQAKDVSQSQRPGRPHQAPAEDNLDQPDQPDQPNQPAPGDAKSATCAIHSTLGDATVKVSLTEGRRYLHGHQNFVLGDQSASVTIVTWNGQGNPRPTHNSYHLGADNLSNADMHVQVVDGQNHYSVDCEVQ